MGRRTAWLLPFLLVATALPPAVESRADGPEPDEAVLRGHVATLASAGYLGRRGVGGRKAAEYLVDHFRHLGLEPLFSGSYEQEIPGPDGKAPIGRNVGALIPGADPDLRDQWVIVSAHYDHLGRRDGVIYPGADDNASGVAMMLEVARSIVEGKTRPRRGVMFVGFDLEEIGLFGSRYFAEHPPVPLPKVSLFITADMIGRALGGVCTPYVFVMGTEHAPGLRPWIESAARGRAVRVGLLGSDLVLLDRSDYGPFRARKVPYLFFSTGENPLYHTPRDTAETLDYPKLTAISRLILGICRRAADAESVPGWSAPAQQTMDEAETIRQVLRTFLEHRDELKIGATKAQLMGNTLRALDAIVGRGTMTPEERTGVVRVARFVLISTL